MRTKTIALAAALAFVVVRSAEAQECPTTQIGRATQLLPLWQAIPELREVVERGVLQSPAEPAGAKVPLRGIFAATDGYPGPTGGLAGLIGGAAYSAWRWRTRKRVDGALLSVVDGVLTVRHHRQRIPDERFPLSALANVTLDLKTVQRVVDGPGAIPATRLINSQVAPKIDTARIVLVDASGAKFASRRRSCHIWTRPTGLERSASSCESKAGYPRTSRRTRSQEQKRSESSPGSFSLDDATLSS